MRWGAVRGGGGLFGLSSVGSRGCVGMCGVGFGMEMGVGGVRDEEWMVVEVLQDGG